MTVLKIDGDWVLIISMLTLKIHVNLATHKGGPILRNVYYIN